MTVDLEHAGGGRMPVLYLSHGAPPLADDTRWCADLASWSTQLPRPEAVLVISTHWEEAPLTVGATSTVPLTYDFRGFPQGLLDLGRLLAPLFVALGATVDEPGGERSVIDGYWYRLSKRSWQFD